MTNKELLQKVNSYAWYHKIEVAPGIFTPPRAPAFSVLWDFIERSFANYDFRGKRVLDIGCRDGLFSFMAERRGAASVHGVDIDLSKGATEFLIPHFSSRVTMEKLTVYDLDPARYGPYDTIMFFGILYHLRYPIWALKKLLDCLAVGGDLLLESGMMKDTRHTKNLELMGIPVNNSPYEPTSCTFFNKAGLVTTIQSLGARYVWGEELRSHHVPSRDGSFTAARHGYHFKKFQIPPDVIGVNWYWDGTHHYHSQPLPE